MAGVTSRKYADGAWRIWYIDRAGKQKFAKGTRNKRESHQWAKVLEVQERGLNLGIYKEVLLRHAPATLAHKRYVKVRSGRPNEAVERVAAALGLTYFYAKTMPKPQKLAVGQDYNPLYYQGFRFGEEVVGAPGFEPISAIDAQPQFDHNSLTNKPHLATVQNHPHTDSAAKPQPDDTQTHELYANSMPMSGYAALAHVVAAWPVLSSEDQQRILAIVQGRSAP